MELRETETSKKILEHRNNCKKWNKKFCLDCFGGGLTQFAKNIDEELRKKKEVLEQ